MKWLRTLTVFLVMLGAIPAWADHLVGGEFQVNYVGNYAYDIKLNVYGDVAGLTGPQGNEDPYVEASFFSKKTNQLIETFQLPIITTSMVPYKNLACQAGLLGTKILIYGTHKTLPPTVYKDPEGYYLVWERCCRNAAAGNILQPQNSGFVFYAEVPAVVKNNLPFVNSLPVFPDFPADYLCVQQLYQYSLQATDADGDSLVYSLSVPLKGHTAAAQGQEKAPGLAGPYAPVDWAAGFGLNNMIQGNPALTVNAATGLISVKPSLAGLFVFAVKCEEFRNGAKIGEVRRDIQVKVNVCEVNKKPVVKVTAPNNLPYQNGDTLIVSAAADFCQQFNFGDPNSGQTISTWVVTDSSGERPQISGSIGTVTSAGQVFTGQLCWNSCPPATGNNFFKMYLIASDDACDTIATDTLQLYVKINRKINNKPEISVEGFANQIEFGQAYHFKVNSSDADNDPLSVQMVGKGFDPVALGMSLTPVSGQGKIVSDFTWNPGCDFEILPEGYNLELIVKDNSCQSNKADTTRVKLKILPPSSVTEEFLPPNIFTPNNDGRNDFFVMPILPGDNCSDTFQEIKIYNRWGMEVFRSADRQFAWDGKNVTNSVYFYVIRNKKKSYKGYVTIVW